MKTINFFLTLALLVSTVTFAQVGIGTDDPHPSAILEVDVTSLTDKQGFLPPRLSSAERDAIASPPQGLTIFNTTTNAIEFSDGTDWVNLNDNSTVAVNTDAPPTGNGDVGIGTETPDANAALDVVSTDRGFLPPRMTTTERDAIASPTKGLVIFNETTTCLQWYDGSFWFDGCTGSEGALSECSDPEFIPPFLPADETIVKDVTNPVTGETWMDRNLGAYTADRSTPSAAGGTDCWAYGNLYQWGRNSDVHESRLLDCAAGDCFDAGGVNTSLPSTAADVTDPTWAGKFIYKMASPFDWHQANPDNTLWTSTGGTNNPCPAGYRVPTETELNTERSSWTAGNNIEGAITSPLKLPVAGYRGLSEGELTGVGFGGLYWSSTASTDPITTASCLYFISTDALMYDFNRANGLSVRCLKE